MHLTFEKHFNSLVRHSEQFPGTFGVELEYEGKKLPKTIPGWVGKKEGSLRGEAIEYALDAPVVMADLSGRLDRLFNGVKAVGGEIILTPRASTHIHMNIQRETFLDILNFILVFTILEPVIFRLCGPERNGNLFCLPSYETGDLPAWVASYRDLVRKGDIGYLMNRGKYASLNTNTLSQFGSLEARCFPNTDKKEKILQWAQWLLNIKGYVSNLSDKTLDNTFSSVYNNPEGFVERILHFRPTLGDLGSNISDLIHYGLEHAYEARHPILDLFEKNQAPAKRGKKRVSIQPVEAPISGGGWGTPMPGGLLNYTTLSGLSAQPMVTSAASQNYWAVETPEPVYPEQEEYDL